MRALNQILPNLGYDVHLYCAQQIRSEVARYAKQNGTANTKRLTTALSAYLKYLITKDLCSYSLLAAIPTVAHWPLASLPRYIPTEDIQRLILSCDTDQPLGMRDHAVLLLLARLGLRASDIVNLRMSDIDWHRATFRVRGKARKESLLPLPQDAGDAILRYIEKGRVSNTPYEQLFLCITAPHRPLGRSQDVSSIVRSAIKRSGIVTPPSSGAHLLRHSSDSSEDVPIPKTAEQRKLHKAFLRYHDPQNWPMLRDALRAMGRSELIGNGRDQLIPTFQPRDGKGYQSARRKNSTPAEKRKGRGAGSNKVRKGQILSQHTGLPPRSTS